MSTVIGFVLGALALAGCFTPRLRRTGPWFAGALAALGAVYVVRACTEAVPSAGMSATRASCFLCAGIALLLSRGQGRRAGIAAQVLAAGLVLACLTVLTGQLSQVLDPAAADAGSYMPVVVALGFAALGIGIVLANRRHGVGLLLADPGAGGRQLRRLLPAVMVVPLSMYGAALTGFRYQWYDAPVVHALLTAGNACVLAAVAIWSSDRSFALEAARARLLMEVAEQEYQFRSAFENAFVGMGVVDRLGRWLRVNERLGRILRVAPDQLVGAPVGAVLPAPVTRAFHERTAPVTMPGLRVKTGGEELFLDVGVTRLEQGGDRFLVTLHDITELRRTAEQLRLSERALGSTITGVVITDARLPDRKIVYVNQAFTRITGYQAAEALGRNCRFLNEGLRNQPGLDELRRALDSGQACAVQLGNRRKDGSEFWIRLSVSPVHGPGGELTHWVGVQEDISTQIAASQEREVLLQVAVADRERAEKASRARDTLLAVVSHELRSPLHGMRLWASLLTKKQDPDTVTRAARQIEQNIAAQSRLIGDLVDVSRIESGRLELERTPTDLGALCERVLEALRPAAEDKALQLRLQRPQGRLIVHADSGRMEQVLRNVLDNAIKFTDRGGRVAVTVAPAGERAQVVVEDTGKGMTSLQQQHAFDIFWQGDKEDTRSHGGLGLGLYLVRQIIERHEGYVQASSEGPGCGTRLCIDLPIVRIAPARSPVPLTAAASTNPTRTDILVVDDERSTAEGLALALRFRGFPVRLAATADQALALIRDRRPRVLLSDIMMPEKSGVDLIAALREDERQVQDGAPVHAIAMSGRGSPADRRRLLRAGFDDYLQKPIDVDGLVARIDGALVGVPAVPQPAASRVLLAVADQTLLGRLRQVLASAGHEVASAGSTAQARACARDAFPDVLVVGTQMPDGSGADLARELLEDRQSLWVIGVGSAGGTEADVYDLLLAEPVEIEALELGLRSMRTA